MIDAPSTIAIAVVLLPPAPVQDWAQSLNRSLLASEPGFALGESHLPHITLVQQSVQLSVLTRVVATVECVASESRPLPLRIIDHRRAGTTCSAIIEPMPDLLNLHRRLMDTLSPFAESEVSGQAFVNDGEPPRARDIEWVQRFRHDASGDRFEPHITLGVGPAFHLQRPLPFVATELAVCHLGRYCTCRRILSQWKLVDDLVTDSSTSVQPHFRTP